MTARGPGAPGFDPARDVLFVGLGTSPVAYYRCFLPALALGADWVGAVREPPDLLYPTGIVRAHEGVEPRFLEDYKVVVLQQVQGDGWCEQIQAMQAAGVKVIYEVDDYLHGIKAMKDEHGYHKMFDLKTLGRIEAAMKLCDGLITTTDWIKRCYRKFVPDVYVCENGLDLARYDLTRPERDTVNIGWSGGTGHRKAVGSWLQKVLIAMQMRENTAFVSVGEPFAKFIAKYFPERALATPWAAIEQYPAAMSMFDLAIAPAGSGGWWKGKSHLRWLEASALGVPVIANPVLYPKIRHGETGYWAVNPEKALEIMLELIDNDELRRRVGQQAKEHVWENYGIHKISQQWVKAFREILGEE